MRKTIFEKLPQVHRSLEGRPCIVGAGPAGLAMAAELTHCGLPHRVIERGRMGEAWHHHYDRLRLHTLKQVSALPGLPMPPDYPDFPSRAQFLAYLQQYARHFALPIDEGIELRRADFKEGRWLLTTSSGVLDASAPVMATGTWSAPVRPRLPGEERFASRILHSRDYRNPQLFRGQRVLVVGAGNSGAEIAVDLAEHGVETGIVVRGGVAFVPRPRAAAAMRLAAWGLRTLPAPTTEGWLQALGRVARAAADGLTPAMLNAASDGLKVAGENVERGTYENGS